MDGIGRFFVDDAGAENIGNRYFQNSSKTFRLLSGYTRDESRSIFCTDMEGEGFAGSQFHIEITVIADTEVNDGVCRIVG